MDSEAVGGCFAAIVMIALLMLIMTFPTLWLWNWLMPDLFGLTTITFWQALGLNILCSILFKSHNTNNNS